MGDSRDDAVYGTNQSDLVNVTSSSSDVEIVSEPKYISLDTTTSQILLPDEEGQYHVVTGIGWTGKAGTGNFFLHGGDGVAKGPRVYFSANSGDFMPVRIKFSPGDPVKANVSLAVGAEVAIYVEYHTVPISTTQPANSAEYPDA